jgi:hypothetical protein
MHAITPRFLARVQAINLCAMFHNIFLKTLQDNFAPHVGEKILKVDGTLLEKFKKLMPKIEDYKELASLKDARATLHFYRLNSDYSLGLCVRVDVFHDDRVGGNHESFESTAYVGDLRGQILEKLSLPSWHKSDYSPEEIFAQFKIAEELAEKARQAESVMSPFSLVDASRLTRVY